MTDNQKKAAAIKLCEIRKIDPEKMAFGVLRHCKTWKLVLKEIEDHLDLHKAINHGKEVKMLNRDVCEKCKHMGDNTLPIDPSDILGTWLCWDDKNCGGSPVHTTDENPPSHCPHKSKHLNLEDYP